MRWCSLLLALALLGPVVRFDQQVQAVAQAARRPALEWPMSHLSSATRPAGVLGGLLAIALFDAAAGIPTVRGCVAVLLCVNLSVEALKWTVGRARPDGERHRSNSSFPSSHAANALALAWMLTRRWPRGALPFFAFAILVALSRIYLNRHFLSDVAAASLLGIGLAVLITRRWPVFDPRLARAAARGGGTSPG